MTASRIETSYIDWRQTSNWWVEKQIVLKRPRRRVLTYENRVEELNVLNSIKLNATGATATRRRRRSFNYSTEINSDADVVIKQPWFYVPLCLFLAVNLALATKSWFSGLLTLGNSLGGVVHDWSSFLVFLASQRLKSSSLLCCLFGSISWLLWAIIYYMYSQTRESNGPDVLSTRIYELPSNIWDCFKKTIPLRIVHYSSCN